MKLRLAILSALEVLAFAGALIYFLRRISATLMRIGGRPDSYLAKISFGVRAIEKETSHLTPQATQLNSGLAALAAALGGVNERLGSVAQSLTGGQEASR